MFDLNQILPTVREKLTDWLETLIEMLPNIVVAVLVLLVFWFVAQLAGRFMHGLFRKVSRNDQAALLVSRLAYLAVLVGGTMIALSVLNLEKTVTSLLAGVGIIGLALGFAFQDLAANLMSGFMIAVNEPLSSGDLIENSGQIGFVESVTLRFTVLRTFQGQLVRIPNRMIFENPLVNYTQTGERRVDIEVGVSYGDDLDKVRKVTLEAVEGVEERDSDKPVELYYREFGSSSINFIVRFWIDVAQHDFFEAHSDAILRIKKAFDDNDITIPFPIRTLDFSEVGGNLSQPVTKLLGQRGTDSSRGS